MAQLKSGSTVGGVAIVTTDSMISDINGLSDGYYAGYSLGLGPGALANDDGSVNHNTAIGYESLNHNTNGYSNTANGYRSLYENTLGSHNTATGYRSLYFNTTGVQNTASGYYSLRDNTTGSQNTASGYYSLRNNTTSIGNTASGMYSLYSNTTASYNTASGAYSLYANTTGIRNTASGMYSLYSNTTASYNTASGMQSLYYNTTGARNTASGHESLKNNTTGAKNIGLGYGAGDAITTGSNNTIIGDLPGSTALSDTVLIGAGTTERLKVDASGLQVNGSPLSTGKVLQVVSTTKTDTFSTTSTSLTDITGLSVSITPSSSTSKILVISYITGMSTSLSFSSIVLKRDSTEIFIGDAGGVRPRVTGMFYEAGNQGNISANSPMFLDSPSTTSTLTYKVQARVGSGGGTIVINKSSRDTNTSTYDFRSVSSITVMEIGA